MTLTVLAVTFQSSLLFSIFTCPPPGWWAAFAREPILEEVFLRFGEGDTPTTTLFIGTEAGHRLVSAPPWGSHQSRNDEK